MTTKRYVKAFIAGMAFPGVALPLAYSALFMSKHQPLMHHPIQFIPMYLPLVWGLANMVYAKVYGNASPKKANVGYWVIGIVLGFIVAAVGIYALHLPHAVFGVTRQYELAPLVIVPIVYGLVFRYIVKWLNKVVAI